MVDLHDLPKSGGVPPYQIPTLELFSSIRANLVPAISVRLTTPLGRITTLLGFRNASL